MNDVVGGEAPHGEGGGVRGTSGPLARAIVQLGSKVVQQAGATHACSSLEGVWGCWVLGVTLLLLLRAAAGASSASDKL